MSCQQSSAFELTIDSLAHDGRGVGKHNGKAVFVDGALPGELVQVRLKKRQRKYDTAELEQVLQASVDRVEPKCEHFHQCGGCSLQHLSTEAQMTNKQQQLQENLSRIGKVSPNHWLEPLQADLWAYRRKARLGVRYVHKKGRVLIGFREKGSSFITDTRCCEVLHPSVGLKLEALVEAVNALSIRDQVPQIEVAVGEQETCLIVRVMQELTEQDNAVLKDLAKQINVTLLIQPGGMNSIYPLAEVAQPLYYDLPEWDLRLFFEPHDFTQVNLSLNRQMLKQALHYLQPAAEDTVLDLFCGLGNFSLPLARQAGHIIGAESDAPMVNRAEQNARHNGLSNCEFFSADLFAELTELPFLKQSFNKVLLDPPRSGAEQVVRWLAKTGQAEIVVYVSCNPSTLARDADILVHEGNYQLTHAGAMDMFPHTAHVEAMAVFSRVN